MKLDLSSVVQNARFGHLVVIDTLPVTDLYHRQLIHCHCDCGRDRWILVHLLLNGQHTDCGCAQRARRKLRQIWDYIRKETTWSSAKDFLEWGVSGFTHNDLLLVRLDEQLPYGPENCQWLTHLQASARGCMVTPPRGAS